jgi:hypothetical protein
VSVLHIGIRRADVTAVLSTIEQQTEGFAILDLGETLSWEQWGEEDWAAGEPQHVLIGADNPDVQDYDYLALVAGLQHAHPGSLQPMTFRYQRGILACITPYDDWSEPTFQVVDVQAKRWLERYSVGDERTTEDWWDRISWREYLATRGEAGQ